MELWGKMKKVFGPEYNGLDFSSGHDFILVDDDGSKHHLDENYMEATLIAPGTWRITTYGDYIYLIEGDDEAVCLDTGFGIGNLRKMCQTLTDKPIRRCIISHEHGDHLGGASYFEEAWMTETCAAAVADYNGLMHGMIEAQMYPNTYFPKTFETKIVHEGDIIRVGSRELEVFEIPDHAAGSLALLDRKYHILFTGDELGTPAYKQIMTSVEQYYENVNKLYQHIDEVEMICGGGFCYDANVLFRQKHCLELIMHGQPGVPFTPPEDILPELRPDPAEPVDGRRFHIKLNMLNLLRKFSSDKMIMTFGYSSMIYDQNRIHKKA